MALFNIDEDASVEEHACCIERDGASYVRSALDASRPGETRGRALLAAVKVLGSASVPVATQQMTQGRGTQGAATRVTKLESVVAATVGDGIPATALVEAVEGCVEAGAREVLLKVLCLISGVEFMRGGAESEEEEAESEDEVIGKKRKGKNKAVPTAKKRRQRKVSATGSGKEFVDEFVVRLCGAGGGSIERRGDDVFVATAARESPMSAAVVPPVLENLIARLWVCDVYNLPAFIYQMLLLVSARGNALAKRNILRSIVVHFADLEDKHKSDTVEASHTQGAGVDDIIESGVTGPVLRQIQSTALFHIDFAVKQDPGLLLELTKLARAPPDSPHSIVTPFGVAILLALSRTPSVQQTVMNTIRDAVVAYDNEVHLRATNPFVAGVVKSDPDTIRDPRATLRRAVESTSKDGWDMICEPLLHLSFVLIDKCVTVWSPAISTSSQESRESEAELGANLLTMLFAAHQSLRSEIVGQLISRIALREKSSPLAVHILSLLAERSPSDLLGCSGKIKESVADLVSLPPWTACSLINAYQPLLRVRPDMQDYMFLALRKALFHRDPSARAVASTGFLTVIAPTSSRIVRAGSGSSPLPAILSASALEDAIQPLRRSLTHPPAIRALLYKEVRKLACSMPAGPEEKVVCAALLELLKPHVLRYVDASSAPFLLLDHCINESSTEARLVEPLGDLLACYADLQRAINANAFSSGALLQLAKSVATISVSDFDISKVTLSTGQGRADDGGQDSDGEDAHEVEKLAKDKANRNRARVLGSVLEALLSACLSSSDSNHTADFYNKIVFPLLQLRDDVLSVLKELGAISSADAIRDLGGMRRVSYSLFRMLSMTSRKHFLTICTYFDLRPDAGNVDIEPGAGRSIGWFGGAAKGGKAGGKAGGGKGGGGRKDGGKKKGKKGGAGDGGPTGGTATGDLHQRFGAFGILVSSSSSPLVSLSASAKCLASMLTVNMDKPGKRQRRTSEAEAAIDVDDLVDVPNSKVPRPVSKWFAKHEGDKSVEKLSSFLTAVAKAHLESSIDAVSRSSSQLSVGLGLPISENALLDCICEIVAVSMSQFQHHRVQTGISHSKSAVRSLELAETCIVAVANIFHGSEASAVRLCSAILLSSSLPQRRNASSSRDGSIVVAAIEGMEKMFDALVEDKVSREAEVVIRLIIILRDLYCQCFCVPLARDESQEGQTSFVDLCSEMAVWARTALDSSPATGEGGDESSGPIGGAAAADHAIMKGLVSISLNQRESHEGLKSAETVATRIHAVLGNALAGGEEEPDNVEYSGPYALVSNRNVLSVVEALIDVIASAFDDSEWGLSRASSLEAAVLAKRSNVSGTGHSSQVKRTQTASFDNQRLDLLERQCLKAEDQAQRRLKLAIASLTILLKSSIGKAHLQERLLKTLARGYKLMSLSVAAQARRNTEPRTSFLEMIMVGKRLTPIFWDFVVILNQASADQKASSSMAAKEARIMPQIVYEIERFEKLLISAQKRTKINLLSELLRNQARDMKIDDSHADEGDGTSSGQNLSIGGLLNQND